MTQPSRRADERGAVFVEKLIVYLPLLMAFFAAWELAELGAAHIVTQRACAAAGRAAMVVLGDDPTFYDGEPPGSFDGQRRADIELAAGMILSAIPRMKDDFSVELADEPSNLGDVFEVTLTASYDCAIVSMICGGDDALELVATSKHTYHGARYPYSSPDVSGGGAALTTNFHSGEREYGDDFGDDDDEWQWRSGFRATPFTGCGKGNGAAAYDGGQSNPGVHLGTQKPKGTYGKGGLSEEALKYRCAEKAAGRPVGAKNVAVIRYKCDGDVERVVVDQSGDSKHSEPNVYEKFKKQTTGQQNCEIKEFYTEREPCDDGANCSAWFSKQTPEVRNNITYDFGYNPKRSVNTTKDPYYKEKKKACTKIKKDYKAWFAKNKNSPQLCNKSPRPDSCLELQRWANTYAKGKYPNLKECLEFLQAKEDFTNDGPRKQYEKDTKKAYDDAEKRCPTIDYSDYVEDADMGGT
jgi:hypothetical protein